MARPLRLVLAAALIALPAAALAARAVALTVSDLLDPCVHWGSDSQASLGPGSPCRSVSGRGESKLRGIAMTALVPGGILVAAVTAVTAAAKRSRRMMGMAAALMLAETLAVFTIAPLTLLAGIAFLLVARRLPG